VACKQQLITKQAARPATTTMCSSICVEHCYDNKQVAKYHTNKGGDFMIDNNIYDLFF